MNGLDSAIEGLEQALARTPQHAWGGLVRQRMASVHEAFLGEPWQAAREGHLSRERKLLAERINRLRASEHPDPEVLSAEVRRLLADLEHHRQRINDLVYDSVSMDLGGSE